MNYYAPVLIMTLDRYEHFRRCVESLSACADSDKTDLYIAFDYPLKDTHWDGYKKIENYIEKIQGFKNVHIIKRNVNFGAFKNYFDAQAEIFEKYDRIIISEDDNVFAPSFLSFANQGLSAYVNRPDIFSVSGYNYPVSIPSWYRYDAYLIQAFAGWGVGLWREKWNKVDYTLDSYNSMLSKKENYKKIKQKYKKYLPGLLKIRDSGLLTGDYFMFLYLLDKNMYSILPVKTRVRNTGCDASGVHAGYSSIHLNQKTYDGLEDIYFPPDLQPDKQLMDFIIRQFKLTFIEKIKGLIPYPVRMKILL